MDFVMALWLGGIDLLKTIPATFWGIIIGSCFTIAGVHLTNRSNAKLLKEQLTHERTQRLEDHEYSMRKEAFGAAAEAFAVGMQSIIRYADLNVPDADITREYLRRAPSLARLNIIAGEEVLAQLNAVAAAISTAILELTLTRIRLSSLKSDIDEIHALIDAFAKEHDNMLEMMKQYNLQQNTDKQLWNTIQGNLRFEQDRIRKHSAEKAELSATLSQLHMAFIEECTVTSGKIVKVSVPAIIALRRELGIATDEAALTSSFEGMADVQSHLVNGFIGQAKTAFS